MVGIKLPQEAKQALKLLQGLANDISGIRKSLERLVELEESKSE